MTEVEKRRLTLLQETRKNYSDKQSPPAIHPRYQSTYQSLYGREDEEVTKKSTPFFIRLFLSMFLFALFFVMDYKEKSIGMVDSQVIIAEIQKSFSQSLPEFIKGL